MSFKDQIGESWFQLLKDEIKKEYFRKIPTILKKERKKYNIYPKSEDVFNAYKLTPYKNVKCVVLGQDPFHGKNQAHGLAFSVRDNIETPPSLQNIFEEIERDLGFLNLNWSTDLTPWANQGVFLLNRSLTVREGLARSHHQIGWEKFTFKTIQLLNHSPQPIVFMLWGNDAKDVGRYIDHDHHLVLTASHPSPLAAYLSFDGCSHFSKCNEFLKQHNLKPINWKTTL